MGTSVVSANPKDAKLLSRRSGEEALEQICSKRLHPYLPEGIKVLKHCGELQLASEAESSLLQISHSSIDPCLTPVRFPNRVDAARPSPAACSKRAQAKDIPSGVFLFNLRVGMPIAQFEVAALVAENSIAQLLLSRNIAADWQASPGSRPMAVS